MPLPRLPDISLDSWIRDQQQQFERTISGLAEATEFKDAISDVESQVPADYPHPGGTDQWAEAQRQQQEEEYRRQQEEDQRRQAEESQRQYEAYLTEKMRHEQEQQQQDALTQAQSQAQDLGIPSPDQAAESFQQVQPGDIPQPVQDFHSFADQIEQGQMPEGLQAPPPVKRGVPSPYSLTPPPEEPLQAPPPVRRGVPSPYDVAPPPEPERPYWTPTAREQEGLGPSVGPDWLPEPIRQAAGVVTKAVTGAARATPQEEIGLPTGRSIHVPEFAQQAVGSFGAAMEPLQSVDDYTSARLDPETWYFARDGIARTELDPGELERWNELQGSRRLEQGTKTTWTPEETAEIQRTTDKIDRIYQSIKDDPDKLNDYAKASPAYEITRGITHTVLGGALGNVVGGAAGSAARGLGAGHRTIRAAEYAGDIAAQTVFDPTTPALQPLGDLAIKGLGAGVRSARGLAGRAGRALEASADALPEGPVRTGSGFQTAMDMEADPSFGGMRPRVIPTEVARQLDYFPLNVPTDPEIISAVRHAGGTIDEHGVTVNTIRNQGPEAAGGTAARGGTFHIAGEPGARNDLYAKDTSSPTGVGGQQRIEGETTFRNPLWLDHAPGDGQGFDQAMREMNVTGPGTPQEIALAEMRVRATEEQLERWKGALASDNPDAQALLQERQTLLDKNRRELADLRSGRGRPVRAAQVNDEIREAQQAGREGSPERARALKALVSRHGGDPELIDDLLAIRGSTASESAWAIRENIVTAHARRNRHDGVLALTARDMTDADWKIIEQHPRMVAANKALQDASKDYEAVVQQTDDLYEAGQRAGMPEYDRVRAEYRRLSALVDQRMQAVSTIQGEVQAELGTKEISELVDPRAQRNPTPGIDRPLEKDHELNRLSDAIEGAREELGAAYDARDRAYQEWGMKNPSKAGHEFFGSPEGKELHTRVEGLDAVVRDLEHRFDRMFEGTDFQGPPGYELRPDIPAPEGVRRSTIIENPEAAAALQRHQDSLAAADAKRQAAAQAWEAFNTVNPDESWAETLRRRQSPQGKLLSDRLDEAMKVWSDLKNTDISASEPRYITALGSGVSPRLRAPLFNAAQGGVVGAVSEPLEYDEEGRPINSASRLRNIGIGAGLGVLAGSRGARRVAGRALQAVGTAAESPGVRRLGSGVVPEGAGEGVNIDRMIQGIRQIRSAGAADDAVLAAERHVAENTNLTLPEVQARTRAVEALPETTMLEPPPRPGEEIASSVAAAENRIPEDLEQGYLPGMRPRTRRPSAAQQAEATVNDMREEVRGRYQDERTPFKLDDIWAQAAKLRRTTPEKLQEIFRGSQAQRGDEAAVAGTALRQEAAALGEQTRLATQDRMLAAKNLDDELLRRQIDPLDLPARRDALKGKDPVLNDLADELEASVQAEAASVADFEAWQKGDFSRRSSAALELRSVQKTVSARRAYRQLNSNREFFSSMEATAAELLAKGDQMTDADWTKLRDLQRRIGEKAGSEKLLDEVSGRRIRDIEREGIAGAQKAKGTAGRAPKEAPPETLAERYGRLARRFDEYNAEGDTDAAQTIRSMMDDTVDEMKLHADERAIKILDQELPDAKTPEEGMKIIQKSIGDRIAQKLNKAALAAEDVREGPGGVDLSMKQWRDLQKLQKAFQNRLDRAFKSEANEQVRIALRKQVSDARYMMGRALDDPTFAPAVQEFRDRVEALRQQPGVGKTTGEKLAKILDDAYHDQSAERVFTQNAKDEVGLLQSRIRGIQQQLDEAIKNKDVPGAQARVKELLQDMQDVGGVGKTAADKQRERLIRQNLHDMKDVDQSKLRDALATVDLNNPESIRGVLDAMRNPTKWDKFREGSYISMLSNPWTTLTNLYSNLATTAGHLGLQNPLERLYGGEAAGGSRAAWEEFKAARGEGGQRALDVLKTGRSQQNLEQLASGDMAGLRREYLTEQGGMKGKLAEWYHRLSTRPLEAGDQMVGHMVYQSEIGKLAQREADRLLKAGDARVVGMTPLEARKSIMTNIWDHPEIMDKARQVRDQVLLREKGTGRFERGLRSVAALRDPGLNPTTVDRLESMFFDFALPFVNVPLNYARQGVQRSFGSPYYLFKGIKQKRAGDIPGAAENLAKGTISLAAMGTAVTLYANDALSGAGPEDPGDRKIWLQTHQPYSVKDPLGNWHSYAGSPLAIPFAVVAGAGEGWEKPGSTPLSGGEERMTRLGGGLFGLGAGLVRGIGSQSFLQGLSQQLDLVTNPNFALGNASQMGAALAMRYGGAAGVMAGAPTLAGMSGFLASMTDRMERDAGRPKEASEFLPNVGARMASRIPGARWNLDPRIDAYGQPETNKRSLQESYGLGAIDPYYRGPAPRPGDRISQDLGALGVGRPSAPDALTIQGYDVPLTIHEQREFDTVYGQTYREILDELEKSRVETTAKTGERPAYSADLYLRLREAARKAARGQILATIPEADLEARLTRSIDQKLAAPRR